MGSADPVNLKLLPEDCNNSEQNDELERNYSKNLKILPTNDQVKELQTILRDK